jgi:hypothetical protein
MVLDDPSQTVCVVLSGPIPCRKEATACQAPLEKLIDYSN